MINKNLLLLTALVATSCLQSMQEGQLLQLYVFATLDIDRVLADSVEETRSHVAETKIPLERILERQIVITGPNVTTPLSELELMDKTKYDASLLDYIKMLNPHAATLSGFTQDEHAKFRRVIKLRVWRDESHCSKQPEHIRTVDYLARADQETKRRLIAYLVEFSAQQNAFMQFYMAPRTVLVQRYLAQIAARTGNRHPDTATIESISRFARAQIILGVEALREKTKRTLLARFNLEAPTTPIDYAAIITRTKQRLTELSEQQ